VLANTEKEVKERDEAIKKAINEFFEKYLSGSKERYKENNKYRH
jgi:formylmethanofuran dehydrogenase subunit A